MTKQLKSRRRHHPDLDAPPPPPIEEILATYEAWIGQKLSPDRVEKLRARRRRMFPPTPEK
ncbi:hypothetical protein [Methylocystis sp. ATCC 49242]|uniref:hypothetical protein n=1 Tax=Methylocystis sp. ATCC 49242 TaxID=622637 RepID=UPI00031A0F48|nr:hypothetical protein [Methylocystis sp. ATCC 49242]